jgi:hypothetical protein
VQAFGVLDGHAMVGAAVRQQQRAPDAGGLLQRRGGGELGGVLHPVADHPGHAVAAPFVAGIAPPQVVHHVGVRDCRPRDAAAIQVAVADQPRPRTCAPPGTSATVGQGLLRRGRVTYIGRSCPSRAWMRSKVVAAICRASIAGRACPMTVSLSVMRS